MRILVVEDDAILAEGTCESLSKAGYAVDLAETGTRANAMIEAGSYDLVLLDIGLPGMDGFEVLRRLRKHNRNIPVLIISARDDIDFRVYGLDLGADDFMLKPFVLAELHARTRALLRRHALSERNTLSCGELLIDLGAQRAHVDGEPLELSIREWDVLVYLLRNQGKVVRKEAIVETLCDWKTDITLNAVEVYISRLRSKLDSHGVHIRTVRGFGYLLEEPAE
ncbi:response regulator transcription factor [Methylobacillus caricis]|uniref:response regulator n=1 Tax=Methylobacillus caricis TaxID=1971611 RepID=UPI001CFF903D|nr:response regulator transcription factor [Methylobacillus caricis]MCB5187592.1 response regulator transcription factor [Methylobacillus caricis]